MGADKQVLIIDDEVEIGQLIRTVLQKEGVTNVLTATTAKEGLTLFSSHRPDLIILDIMLPDGQGYDVCKEIRETSNIPILFLSAKTEEVDKILGFALGGDDYITKPFSPKELAYRVKAHLRRTEYMQLDQQKEQVLEGGPFALDEATAQLTKNGQIIELKPKEFGLMKVFLEHKNKVISKEQLYNLVWGEDFFGMDNTVMVHISRLRDKIEDKPSKPTYLHTVKGLGYKFSVEDL